MYQAWLKPNWVDVLAEQALPTAAFVAVNKPEGMSSHSCVQIVRRALGSSGRRGIKAGHTGTLDPFATGVLVVLLGRATRLLPYIVGQSKRYRVGVRFGARSDTDDATGTLIPVESADPNYTHALTEELAQREISKLAQQTQQIPPAVSAIHIEGKRAYQRVRDGEIVQMQPRAMRFDFIHILSWQAAQSRDEQPLAILDVQCSAGTYMRALARDLGEAMGTQAYCESLERTAVDSHLIDDTVAPEAVTLSDLRNPLELIPDFPKLTLTRDEVQRVIYGQRFRKDHAGAYNENEPLALIDERGNLVAIAFSADGVLSAKTVFVDQQALAV